MKNSVEIFVDGACRGNPGVGGWGALLRYKNQEKSFYGAQALTTNNRMELTAAIMALSKLTRSCLVEITTDSQYLRKGILEWLPQWKLKNWKTANKKDVKNKDLWQLLETEVEKHQIQWHWIKGHSGHRENEIADSLANKAIDEFLKTN